MKILKETFPSLLVDTLLEQMDKIKQDPNFHAEGNLGTHIRNVIDEIENSNAWKNLERLDAIKTLLAAFLHDIGKISCTKENDGVITSIGHSRIGENVTRDILTAISLPYNIEDVCKLVRYHGYPTFYRLDSLEKDVIEASLNCSIRNLCIIARADVLGRKCEDEDLLDMMANIDRFEQKSKELYCHELPYKFYNDHTKFKFFNEGTESHLSQIFDDTSPRITIMVGMPGAGKDTYIKENNLEHLPVISLDELRKEMKIKPTANQGKVAQAAKERARDFMRVNQDFIWNSTNLSKTVRSGLIRLFREYGARVDIIFLSVPYKELLKRNKKRENRLPEIAIEKLFKKIDIPEITECYHLTVVNS